MAKEIKMPQLSDTMDSGKIVSWMIQEGQAVSRGDILAEVETDKANLEIECFDSGTVLKIITQAGQEANVGDPIAYIGEVGEQIPTPSASSAPKPEPETPVKVQEAPKPVEVKPQAIVNPVIVNTRPATNSRVKASPLAKKIASQNNLELNNLNGSGPNGRITKKDVEQALNNVIAPSISNTQNSTSCSNKLTSQNSNTSSPNLEAKTEQMNKMRQTIAKRMQESKNDNPHFYVTNSINMKEAIKLRAILKETPGFKGITINHLIVKAAGYALKKEPQLNCAFKDNTVVQPGDINIGIIMALDDGLIIPVIKNVDTLGLSDLVIESRLMIDRVKAGKPSSSDLSGGTFSISNMGMFDVENFTAIINPGQGAILAVSSTKDTPVIEDGKVVAGKIMKVTVSSDHRIIDGVVASKFLTHFKNALETPALMMI